MLGLGFFLLGSSVEFRTGSFPGTSDWFEGSGL